jgi:hypothetical protein
MARNQFDIELKESYYSLKGPLPVLLYRRLADATSC